MWSRAVAVAVAGAVVVGVAVAEHSRAQQSRTQQSRAQQSRAQQSTAEQSRAEQSTAAASGSGSRSGRGSKREDSVSGSLCSHRYLCNVHQRRLAHRRRHKDLQVEIQGTDFFYVLQTLRATALCGPAIPATAGPATSTSTPWLTSISGALRAP